MVGTHTHTHTHTGPHGSRQETPRTTAVVLIVPVQLKHHFGDGVGDILVVGPAEEECPPVRVLRVGKLVLAIVKGYGAVGYRQKRGTLGILAGVHGKKLL